MSEKFNPYNLEKAQEEAVKMKDKIKSGKAKDYAEAENLIESEKTNKNEVVLTPEQKEGKEKLIKCLSNGSIDYAFRIIDTLFPLPQEVVQQAAKEGLIYWLSNQSINYALRIIDKFSLPQEVVQQAAKKY